MATSWDQLEHEIMLDVKNAMMVVQLRAETVMKEELFGFYAGGHPKLYVRTGQLGNSSRVSPLSVSGTTAEFRAYLDKASVHYVVPNKAFTDRGYSSYFSTDEVFDAAEAGTAGIVGRPGFWKRSEQRFEQELNKALGQYFK